MHLSSHRMNVRRLFHRFIARSFSLTLSFITGYAHRFPFITQTRRFITMPVNSLKPALL